MRFDIAKQPLSLALSVCGVLLVLFAIRFGSFPYGVELNSASSMPLAQWINGLFLKIPIVRCVLSVIVILINGIYITRIISSKLVLPAKNYLPSIFYIMISCGIFFPCCNLAAVIASYLLIKASISFISSFTRSQSFGKIFSGAIMLGMMPLLYSPSIIFLLMAPLAMGIFRRSGREGVVALVGMSLPILANAYVVWFMGGEFSSLFYSIWADLASSGGSIYVITNYIEIVRVVALSIFGFMTLLSLLCFINASSDMRTTAYKVFIYMICLLALVVVGCVFSGMAASSLPIIAVPASFIIPLFFSKKTGIFPAILYVVSFIAVVMLNVMPFVV